jgi:hypothetical protein
VRVGLRECTAAIRRRGRDGHSLGADLRAGWATQNPRGRGWRLVVEMTEDDHRSVLAPVAQQPGGIGPDGGGTPPRILHGSPYRPGLAGACWHSRADSGR